MSAGEPFGIMPYGTEAMSTLRIEKGHVVVGAEADGRTTADDLGMGKLVNAGKWCIGKPLLARAGADGARALAAGRADRARRRDDAARRQARRRSGRAAPNPMRGSRDLVVLQPEPRRVDRARAAGRRPRAPRRTLWAVSPLAASAGHGVGRPASSIPKESGCVADVATGRRTAGGGGGSWFALHAVWTLRGDADAPALLAQAERQFGVGLPRRAGARRGARLRRCSPLGRAHGSSFSRGPATISTPRGSPFAPRAARCSTFGKLRGLARRGRARGARAQPAGPLDLDPRVFVPGSCAQSVLGRLGATLYRPGDAPAFSCSWRAATPTMRCMRLKRPPRHKVRRE